MLRFHDVAVILYIAAVDFSAVFIAKSFHREAAFQHIFTELTNDLLQLRFERGAVQLLRATGPPGMPELVPLRPKSMRTWPTVPVYLLLGGEPLWGISPPPPGGEVGYEIALHFSRFWSPFGVVFNFTRFWVYAMGICLAPGLLTFEFRLNDHRENPPITMWLL